MGETNREYPSITDFSSATVGAGNVMVDTLAWQKAIDWANAQQSYVRLPVIDLHLAEGAPPITGAAALIGVSPMRSRLFLEPDFVGTALTVQGAGFNGESTCFPMNGPTAFAHCVEELSAGVTLRNFSIIGNRSLHAVQHGIRIVGNVDHLTVEDLFLGYLHGRALWCGAPLGDVRGQLRESSFSRIRVRHCGVGDSTASVSFHYQNESPGHPGADSSNLFTLDDIHIVYPYGRGLEFVESGTHTATSSLYGVIGKKIMLHGRHIRDTRSVGALLHLEGRLKNLKLEVNFAFSDKGDVACRVACNPVSLCAPCDVTVEAMLGDVWSGVEIEGGENINWYCEQNSSVRREMMVVRKGVLGPVNVRCTGSPCFLRLPCDLALNGLEPVAVQGVHPGMGALAFMAVDNTGGTGDTLRIDAGGVAGTLTRAGDATVTPPTDTYMFTPDTASYTVIRAGTRLSKFIGLHTLQR